MTTYKQAVAEARSLIKRSEDDQWRLAELTWEQVEAGKSRAQWARDIGVAPDYSVRLYRVWAEVGKGVPLEDRPAFWDAFAAIKHGVDPADARQVERDKLAQRTVRNASPEQRAEIARELLAEPEVAAKVVEDDQARRTINKATNEHHEEQWAKRAQRTERILNQDPVGQQINSLTAINDLGQACERFSREGNEALRNVGELPESERYWLTGSIDRAEATVRAARRYLELGRSEIDAEINTLLDNGA